MRLMICALAGLVTIAATAPKPAPKATAKPVAAKLAPGPGQALVQAKCGMCHPVSQVIANPKTHDQWENSVENMIGRGAQVSDAEYDVIVAYLSKNYARR
jgi:cytochrome c5